MYEILISNNPDKPAQTVRKYRIKANAEECIAEMKRANDVAVKLNQPLGINGMTGPVTVFLFDTITGEMEMRFTTNGVRDTGGQNPKKH